MPEIHDRVLVQRGAYARFVAELLAPEGAGWRVRIEMFGRHVETVLSLVTLGLAPEPPPTIRALDPPMDYERLFTEPDAVCDPPGGVLLRQSYALRLTSGGILGFDPTNVRFLDEDYAPYERHVAPGLYACWVCVDVATEAVCAVRVRFAQQSVSRWIAAGVAGADHRRIAGRFNTPLEDPYAYECRGVAALCDADAMPCLRTHAGEFRERVVAQVVAADTPPDARLYVGECDNPELLAYRAHDGAPCRAWWGEDAAGQVVALVMDLFSSYHRARPRR